MELPPITRKSRRVKLLLVLLSESDLASELASCVLLQNCTNKFDATALDPRFRFFGNVQIIPSDLGRQITNSTKDERRVPSHPQPLNLPLSTLARHYTHILLAYGSSSPLLPTLADDSSVQPTSALDFVHWYTSHPYPESRIPLEQFIKAKHITVIGHGNVALDVARVILSPPARLAPYDVPQSVLEVLEQLQVQHVSVVGRRAPPQVSFTAKEVREMMNLEGVGMNPIDHSLFDIGAEGLSRQQTRLIDLMRKGSSTVAASASRTWSLDFLRSPLRITPTSITYSLNSLSSSLSAVPTGQTQTVPTDLVIASVGYRSPAVHPDWHDERLGRVRHVDGQVVRADGTAVRGVYASGWAANGARGVLASTMWNAYSVAEKILQNLAANTVPDNQPEAGMIAKDGIVLKGEPGLPLPLIEAGKLVVSYSDWKRIDNEEIRRGGEVGKERERMSWEEVMEFLDIE
ncbi:NADPH adrenodoxin oxidoreductase, mitochondrial [Rhizoctonia solani]|uniref:NADPH adrenodoxin oxidoreductase, mitochondrial n=1 Tax=Rhizoctonia solani TaxID=456999 RepID=A0A8H7IMM0_9AGAM|nr:NADPH adrenodoxin oxidoreductase, mitochondrial [Rhizoctonia solani]